MSITIFELTSSRMKFEDALYRELNKSSRILEDSDLTNIDILYTTVVREILGSIITSVNNRNINLITTDLNNYTTPIVDNILFLIYNFFGISLDLKEGSLICSSIETSVLEDTVKNMPYIDNEDISIIGFTFCSPNSVAIEYSGSNAVTT